MKGCCTLAAVAASLVGSAAYAQLRFDLVGPVFTSNWPGSTDINQDGRVVVGMDGTGQVWRWERGVGVSVMPQLYYPSWSRTLYLANCGVLRPILLTLPSSCSA